MFTAPDVLCPPGTGLVARFEAQPAAVTLRSGEHFSISTMVLKAFDASGSFVPKSPFFVEVYFEPEVLERAGQDFREFIASRPGRAIATFRGFCTDTAASEYARLDVPITVVP
jgi:hypothetical protein